MKRNDAGFVSLFTAILISLLLIVITVSLVSLQILQLRKSTDSEQTLRAYYSAEAGVEDAVSKVLNSTITPGSPLTNTCNASTAFDAPGDAEWTCQNISFSGNPAGKLETPDTAKTIDPGHIVLPARYQSMIVQWNQTNGNAAYYDPAWFVSGILPTQGTYAAVPPLELSILSYPTGGFKASEVCASPGLPLFCKTSLKNVLFAPHGSSAAVVSYSTLLSKGLQAGNCGPLGRGVGPLSGTVLNNYTCYAVIDTIDSAFNDYLFRVRSRYDATSYKFTFKSGPTGAGAEVAVPDGTATIDVTAKAGQTYRRVVSKLPLGGGASAGLNYVIYANGDVCKNFSVVDNVKGPGC
jgi:hypothetical protein